MKKLLALVLALVMTMGLATVATNAAYPDAKDIDLTEAVDVMTAVGVFKGDEKGNFAPKANLDRAAAAKLIAYLDLGEKAAEALPAVKTFNDVPATHWASKYIAYCANAGYISGAGDGNFYPGNALTGYAFGKMVLCVLGYDTTIEGFTGASWTINVAKLMQKNDIDDGVSGSASATLTREQAAQYCLNALKADMVEYDTKGTSIEINGAKIATGASKAETVEDKGNKFDYNTKADGVRQLAEKLYENDLKLTESTSNAFDAPATKWKYKTSDVGTYADAPAATYNNKVTQGTIYTLLGKDVYDDIKDGNATLTAFVNGVEQDGTGTTQNYAGIAQVTKSSSAAAYGSANGTLTEVYIDDDGVTKGTDKYAKVTVIVKNTYLMQADADYNTKTEKLAVDLISGPNTKANLVKDDLADGVSLESFKEDDYILYTYADGKVQSMEKAATVTGSVDSYAVKDSVTIAGTKYKYNAGIDDTDVEHGSAVKYSAGESATVVLDNQGYIIYVDEAEAANDNVVFVTKYSAGTFKNEAELVFVDGKKEVVTVSSKSDTVTAGKVYAYKMDGSKYKLTNYAKSISLAASTTAYNLNKVVNPLNATLKATSSTVYVIEDDDGDITLYTGVKNAPDSVKAATGTSVMGVHNDKNELTYVYMKAADKGISEHSTASDELVFILKVGNTNKPIVDKDDNEYVEVKILTNGEESTVNVQVDVAKTIAQGDLYTKKTTDKDGYVEFKAANLVKDDKDYDTFAITSLTTDAFKFSSDLFTAVGGNSGADFSRYVKTDKVYVIAAKGSGDILDDPAADYELTETTFKGLANYVKGLQVKANGYVAVNSDDEVTVGYVVITGSTK